MKRKQTERDALDEAERIFQEKERRFFWEPRMCSACAEEHHHDCGLQTWCECECSPEDCECGICTGEDVPHA